MTKQQGLEFIDTVINTLRIDWIRECCYKVINDNKFIVLPGSEGKHHHYEGGLVVHTAEVLAGALCSTTPFIKYDDIKYIINEDVLTASCIFHDYGKIYDYEETTGKYHKDMIRHVVRSYAEWVKVSDPFRNDDTAQIIDHISHCILAHHGRPEWGSPVTPKTPEALLVHQADMASSKVHYPEGLLRN